MHINVCDNINYCHNIFCLNYFKKVCILKHIIFFLLFLEIVNNMNTLHINININLVVFRVKKLPKNEYTCTYDNTFQRKKSL